MTETRQITDTEFRIDTLIRREADPQDETTESGIMRAAQTIAAEIDALTAERDAARAHNAELSTELAGANFEGNLAMIQRDEARAEAERLRPAADAWRRMGELHKMGWSAEYSMTQARKLGEEDAARAAKESQP